MKHEVNVIDWVYFFGFMKLNSVSDPILFMNLKQLFNNCQLESEDVF